MKRTRNREPPGRTPAVRRFRRRLKRERGSRFAEGRSLVAEWLEEVKPAAREAAAGFEGAELKSVEVVEG